MQILNKTRGLKCYCCPELISIGHYKVEIHKRRWAHSGCYNKRMAKILFKRVSVWQKLKKSFHSLSLIWKA